MDQLASQVENLHPYRLGLLQLELQANSAAGGIGVQRDASGDKILNRVLIIYRLKLCYSPRVSRIIPTMELRLFSVSPILERRNDDATLRIVVIGIPDGELGFERLSIMIFELW
jgi:hypothetical protein